MFEFATATRIVFGAGRYADAAGIVAGLGVTRALVVTGKRTALGDRLVAQLATDHGIAAVGFAVEGEPTVEVAREGVLAGEGCDGVIAVGGGAALDAGKAIAALLANGGDPLDYLEVIGRGHPLRRPALPFVAVPTTAGTGSEVTRNAVLGDKASGVKASLRSAGMLPAVALVDPDLLVGLPAPVLASCGMDALAQVIEPFLCARANPVTDALAREGITRSARSLARAYAGEMGPAEREDLALTSLFGGMCLANSGLGAVHGFAAPIGGSWPAPHGAVCAALLPAVLEANHRALLARAPEHPSLARFEELAARMVGPGATVGELFAAVEALRVAVRIPGLSAYGVRTADLPGLVPRGKAASSMKANPIPLTDAELIGILERAL